MAECKDCVHNKVCSEVNSLKCRKDFIWYDAKSGCPYYTADVVPKSESLPLDVHAALKQRAVDKAKANVAREIFEEIEEDVLDFPMQDYDIHIILDKGRYDELKKKYTEGEK